MSTFVEYFHTLVAPGSTPARGLRHAWCLWHLHGNLQHSTKHPPGSITYLDVIKAAVSQSKDELLDQLKLIQDKDASAAAWLQRKPPAAWVRYAMIESGISPHKYKTIQAVEATNSVYKSARK